MAQPSAENVSSAEDLNDTDEAILNQLQKGARTLGALADATAYHRNTIGHRIDILEASGIVRNVHETTALYELVDDPRDDAAADDPAALRRRIEDLETENADLEARANELEQQREDAIEALESALDELPADVPGRTAVEDARRLHRNQNAAEEGNDE